jgi:hypothetical protein
MRIITENLVVQNENILGIGCTFFSFENLSIYLNVLYMKRIRSYRNQSHEIGGKMILQKHARFLALNIKGYGHSRVPTFCISYIDISDN